VYVNLEATPFIARTDPARAWCCIPASRCRRRKQVFMLEAAASSCARRQLAQLDDRDVAQLLQAMEAGRQAGGDEGLMAWLEGGSGR
jgi:hypothetical protein